MTTRRTVDAVAREASHALGQAADRLGDGPSTAVLRTRLDRRRRRRTAGALAATAVMAAVVVGDLAVGPGNDPVIVDRAPGRTEPPVSDGSRVMRDGWALVDDPGTFGGDGPQVISGGAVTGEAVVVIGIDAATSDDAGGRTRPAVWRSVAGGPWRRDPGRSFEVGSRWDEAGVVPQDVTSGAADRLVAVGYGNFEPRQEPIAWLSTDGGATWAEAEVGEPVEGSMAAVTWTGERFVAVGSAAGLPATWTSSDGTSWLRQPAAPGEGSFHDLAVHDGRLVAISVIGDGSQVWVTAATASEPRWEAVELPAAATLSALHSDGDTLYAVGTVRDDGVDHDGILLRSTDGRAWEVDERSVSLAAPGEQLPADVLVDGDLLVVVGQTDGAAGIWAGVRDQPLRLVDAELLPVDAHVGTLVAGPGAILAFGTLARDGDVPDVARWERARPSPGAAADPSSRPCAQTDAPAFEGVPAGWSPLRPPPVARARAATVWTGDRLLLVGGETDFGGTRHGDLAAYDPTADAWTCLTAAPFPVVGGHVAWTGERLYAWGGVTAAVYDPTGDVWRHLPSPPAEAPPEPLVVSWTGEELLVWGSRSRTLPVATGVAYDPAHATWRVLAEAPIEINQGGGVWTGTELVVHGSGLDANNRSATPNAIGAAYDPAADRWRQLPPTDLSPQATSVAWTGDAVVVWDHELAARRYEPATDTWRPLPDVPLEFGECYPQSAVLDGGRVFAWFCGQAAILDLETRRWTELDTPITTHWGRGPAPGEVERIDGVPTSAGDGVYFAGAAHEGHSNALWWWRPSG